MSLRTLKFGDRTISYDTGLHLANQEEVEEEKLAKSEDVTSRRRGKTHKNELLGYVPY